MFGNTRKHLTVLAVSIAAVCGMENAQAQLTEKPCWMLHAEQGWSLVLQLNR